ncbi:hypothetical protein FYK55_28590 [Roseiconus nitratireducens]|uniref:Uncharacterized protein n=1 Tax=Roseiconus nitratireducens TaxID=2605748 RepID=A0A5M6CJL4_9BACT|nr:hypothetical protein [Roseiconus nitratireducens]KAA5535408.1 hypothetical protein FYK55_28590 [Roseiconus nitratireducens]
MNPYDPPETTWRPNSSTKLHWFAFAAAATLTSWSSDWLFSDLGTFVSTPTEFVFSNLLVFAFSGMVGAVNLFSPRLGRFHYSPLALRLTGGVVLGLVPIPLWGAIQPYLWALEPLVPYKTFQSTIMICVPVVVCTMVERIMLKFRVRESDAPALTET